MIDNLKPLFSKLEQARFTGQLRLCFECGQPTRAKLIHSLAFSELGRELPTVDQERERDKVAHD